MPPLRPEDIALAQRWGHDSTLFGSARLGTAVAVVSSFLENVYAFRNSCHNQEKKTGWSLGPPFEFADRPAKTHFHLPFLVGDSRPRGGGAGTPHAPTHRMKGPLALTCRVRNCRGPSSRMMMVFILIEGPRAQHNFYLSRSTRV